MTDEIRNSRKVAALIIRDMAARDNINIFVSGQSIPILQLLDDSVLMSSLLKIGLFSIGAQSFSDMSGESFGGRTKAEPMLHIPSAMVGIAFSYALRAMPSEPSKEHIRAESDRIEKVFGRVPLDPILMSEIAAMAREENNVRR